MAGSTNTLERRDPLKTQLHRILRERIASGEYIPDSQLPSESELVDEFGVSRPTVRSALSLLEAEGLIVRRWGVGTFVREPPPISHPIAEALDFCDMIAASGFEPGVNIGQATVVQADVDMALDLGVNQGSDLLRVEKVFTADGVPVIYVVNLTPVAVLGEELMVEAVHRPSITEPIYKFLEDCCHREVEYHIATLEAMQVQEFETRIPDVDPLSPILVMKSVAFGADDQPVFRSLSAYPDKRMRFRLLRQRLATGRIRCQKDE